MPIGAVKQQLVLAVLLSRVNAVTPLELLVDTLWAEAAPRTARKNVQVYVAGIRKLLGPAGENRVEFGTGGYRFVAEPDELDALRFARLLSDGRRAASAGEPAEAAALLEEALSLWRGPVLEGLAPGTALAEYADRIGRLFPAAVEDWADAEIRSGHASNVVDRIGEVAGQHPFRERLIGLQMTALSHCGRQAEALGVFDELRQGLARELGLQPGAALQQLYRRILAGEVNPIAPGGESLSLRAGRRGPAPVVMPPDLADFAGRARELAELETVLGRGEGQVVLVNGPVGVGKTALAVRLGHRLAHRFPDGRLLVRLRSGDGSVRPGVEVMSELVRSVGLTGVGQPLEGQPLGDQPLGDIAGTLGAAWQDWVRGRRVLLVVDGAGGRVSIPAGLLTLPRASATLITGRWHCGPVPGHRMELTGLEVPEAVGLLSAVAGHARVRVDPQAAQRIVLALDLNPMAVRAAGLKLLRLRHLPLAEFATRLNYPAELLEQLDGSDAVLAGRIRAALEELPEREREAVGLLASLPNPRFTLEQAAEQLGSSLRTTLRLLESLMEDDLITAPADEVSAHSVQYELPGLIYSFARRFPAGPG